MKIIDIGICIDNKDPRGFGRIRVRSISEAESERSKAIKNWEAWSKDDPFVYSPFLPTHINIIPQVEQAVKLIRYDSEKDLQNQEYIPGPFTTAFDFSYQNELSQLTETSYAKRAEKSPAIKSFTGEKKTYDDGFIKAESVGTLPKLDDIGISGNYGSDLILSEHGVQLRAGKLIDKLGTANELRKELSIYPIRSRKQSKLSLKKFPTTVKLDYTKISDTIIQNTDIKYLFEYDIDSVTNPQQITFNIFQINKAYGDKYKTDVWGLNSTLDSATSELIYENTTTLTSTNKLKEAYLLVRDFISKLDLKNLKDIEPTLKEESAHPFYFRPKPDLRSLPSSETFLENIFYGASGDSHRRTNGFGLVYSNTSLVPPTKKITKVTPYLKKISEEDQTFAALSADHILYLSTKNNGTGDKKIDFNALDKYEYTQEDYIRKIIPNTFSSVRGEKLIEVLELMVLILLNHTHGILTPPIYLKAAEDQLKKLIQRAKQDMVNNSIRIN